ncbi:hypothetical protein L218DRAFT_948633 [Marasmius fiardii PR-910]|nr:hypothetical protein L218DRAFT_948633 [Marasmius fiardii PR-910]
MSGMELEAITELCPLYSVSASVGNGVIQRSGRVLVERRRRRRKYRNAQIKMERRAREPTTLHDDWNVVFKVPGCHPRNQKDEQKPRIEIFTVADATTVSCDVSAEEGLEAAPALFVDISPEPFPQPVTPVLWFNSVGVICANALVSVCTGGEFSVFKVVESGVFEVVVGGSGAGVIESLPPSDVVRVPPEFCPLVWSPPTPAACC